MCPFFVYSWPSSVFFVLTGIVIAMAGPRATVLFPPIHLLTLGLPAGIAVPAAAGLTGIVALTGLRDAWRAAPADPRTLGFFAVPAAVAAVATAFLGSMLPPSALLWTFAAASGLAALPHLLPRRGLETEPAGPAPHVTGIASTGAMVGALTGLFGVGWHRGGSRSFPAPVPDSVLLSALALGAAASMAVHVPSGAFRWTILVPALIAVFLGMDLGRLVLRWLPGRTPERILGGLLVVSALALGRHLLAH